MKTTIPIALIVLLAIVASAQESHRDVMQRIFQKYCTGDIDLLTVRTEDNGDVFLYLIEKSRLTATPSWDGEGAPPIPQADAVSLGKEILAQRDDEAKDIELLSISLTRLYADGATDRWYYSISYDKKLSEDQPALSWNIHLLMDGTEVQPVKYVEED